MAGAAAPDMVDPDGGLETVEEIYAALIPNPISVGVYDEHWLLFWRHRVDGCRKKSMNRLVNDYYGIWPVDSDERVRVAALETQYDKVRVGIILRINFIQALPESNGNRLRITNAMSDLVLVVAEDILSLKLQYRQFASRLEQPLRVDNQVGEFMDHMKMLVNDFKAGAKAEMIQTVLTFNRLYKGALEDGEKRTGRDDFGVNIKVLEYDVPAAEGAAEVFDGSVIKGTAQADDVPAGKGVVTDRELLEMREIVQSLKGEGVDIFEWMKEVQERYGDTDEGFKGDRPPPSQKDFYEDLDDDGWV